VKFGIHCILGFGVDSAPGQPARLPRSTTVAEPAEAQMFRSTGFSGHPTSPPIPRSHRAAVTWSRTSSGGSNETVADGLRLHWRTRRHQSLLDV